MYIPTLKETYPCFQLHNKNIAEDKEQTIM